MCNQAVCLLSAAIEDVGIPTVAIVLLREVAEAVGPPRALVVPFPHGYPLGAAHDPAQQRAVVRAALGVLRADGPGPVIVDYR
jgi:hypothetical protein